MFPALQYKNYRLYIAGLGLANVGSLMKQMAVGWLAYRLSDSIFLLGLVSFSSEVSSFLIGSVSGVIADRIDKRRLLIITHSLLTLCAFVLGYLTMSGHITFYLMLVLQVAFGCLSGLEMPARQSFANDLVEDKAHLPSAIALTSTLFNTARIIGPSIAGLLIPVIGEGLCFVLYGIMSLAIVACFVLIRYQPEVKPVTKLNFRKEFMEGVHYAYHFEPIRILLGFVAAITLLGVSYMVVLPVFTNKVFHAGAEVFGYMTSASGIGSVVGALYLGSKKNALGLEKVILIGSILMGLGVSSFALSHVLWFSVGALALAGFGRTLIFTGSNTLLQTIAVSDKRGRVLSLYITMFMGALTLGSLLVGTFSDIIGAPYTIFLGGVGCLIISFFYAQRISTITRKTYKIIRSLELNR
ncbi:MAG: MFS transporter [Bacteroidota bacterium]